MAAGEIEEPVDTLGIFASFLPLAAAKAKRGDRGQTRVSRGLIQPESPSDQAPRPANAVAVVPLFGRATSSGASRGRTPWGVGLTLVVISTPDGQPPHGAGRMRPRKIQNTIELIKFSHRSREDS